MDPGSLGFGRRSKKVIESFTGFLLFPEGCIECRDPEVVTERCDLSNLVRNIRNRSEVSVPAIVDQAVDWIGWICIWKLSIHKTCNLIRPFEVGIELSSSVEIPKD